MQQEIAHGYPNAVVERSDIIHGEGLVTLPLSAFSMGKGEEFAEKGYLGVVEYRPGDAAANLCTLRLIARFAFFLEAERRYTRHIFEPIRYAVDWSNNFHLLGKNASKTFLKIFREQGADALNAILEGWSEYHGEVYVNNWFEILGESCENFANACMQLLKRDLDLFGKFFKSVKRFYYMGWANRQLHTPAMITQMHALLDSYHGDSLAAVQDGYALWLMGDAFFRCDNIPQAALWMASNGLWNPFCDIEDRKLLLQILKSLNASEIAQAVAGLMVNDLLKGNNSIWRGNRITYVDHNDNHPLILWQQANGYDLLPVGILQSLVQLVDELVEHYGNKMESLAYCLYDPLMATCMRGPVNWRNLRKTGDFDLQAVEAVDSILSGVKSDGVFSILISFFGGPDQWCAGNADSACMVNLPMCAFKTDTRALNLMDQIAI